MQQYETLDTGKSKRQFDTGSQRDSNEGKGAYELLSPMAIRRLAQLYQRGAAKYDDRNWEKGQPSSVYMQSLLRHAFMHLEGHRDEDHLAAVIWNASGLIYNEEMVTRGKLDHALLDLPDYVGDSK